MFSGGKLESRLMMTMFPKNPGSAIKLWAASPGCLNSLSGPSAATAQLSGARDLRASLELVRANSTSGVILWPFQTDYAVLPGDLFLR